MQVFMALFHGIVQAFSALCRFSWHCEGFHGIVQVFMALCKLLWHCASFYGKVQAFMALCKLLWIGAGCCTVKYLGSQQLFYSC
jgi:hypothetical protein